MNIRTASIEDLQAVTYVESVCFPEAEAAIESDFKKRLTVYSNHFWLLEDHEKLLHYYAKLGFKNEGISESTHDGAVWYDMRLTF